MARKLAEEIDIDEEAAGRAREKLNADPKFRRDLQKQIEKNSKLSGKPAPKSKK